eukprot:jgi/Psemu1/309322/fgenesh1_kg.499_\
MGKAAVAVVRTIVQPASRAQCGWTALEHELHSTAPTREHAQQEADVIFDENAKHRG